MKKLLTILTAAMMMTTLAAAETGTPTDLGTPFADVTATPAPVEETVAPATEVPATEVPAPATEAPAVMTEVPAVVTEAPVEEAAAARSIRIVAFGDADDFYVGNRVGLYAELKGYEGLNVALQWQRWNPSTEEWEDLIGETGYSLWIDTTVGMDGSMWQVVVTIL